MLFRLSNLLILLAVLLPATFEAENPLIQTKFTADPAPLVYKGVVYLYTGHDEDDATGFKMLDWQLYTSTDMVNWTDRGAVASLKTFPWAVQTNDAWAAQVVERAGKFYLYAPVSVSGTPKNVIAVAVADTPYGPFKDALGHPLIAPASDNIDPTVFVDDDGQAYLYWGNPNLWYVKLDRDMVSYTGPVTKVPSRPTNYQEGPWFYRRNGHYYLAYASHCCPEGIGYAMSETPTGPFVYKGMLMEPNPVSSGNHPGIIDYKGHSYLFGFNYSLNWALTNVHRERRSVNVSEFTYNADGTINTLPWFSERGVAQLGVVNPYKPIEAATIAWASGVKTAQHGNQVYVTGVHDGSFIKVAGVDFNSVSPSSFSARVESTSAYGSIEIHVDKHDGRLLGILHIHGKHDENNWREETGPVGQVIGKHDLFFVFRGPAETERFKYYSWQFHK